MKKIYLSLLAAMVSLASFADVTYTCTAGSKFGNTEGCQQVFDNNTNTKWCAAPGDDVYALFTVSEAVYVWGYEFTTANDNSSYGRKPTKWTLYATNDADVAADASSDSWEQISQWENSYIQSKDYTTYRFFCSPATTTAYQYYKLVINKASDSLFQISEFKLCCDTNPVVVYNYKEGTVDASNACDLKVGSKLEGNNLAGNTFTVETADGNAYPVKSYSFTTHDDGSCNDRAPKEWTIEGSNDNSAWYVIDHVTTDPIGNVNYQTFDFTPVVDETPFRYIRVTLNSMKSTGWNQVAEFHVVANNVTRTHYNYVEGDNDNVAKVFDKDAHTKGEGSSMPDGVKFTVQTEDEQPHTVKAYYMTTHDDGSWNDRAPKSWILEGSNDKSEWVTIDEVTDGNIPNVNYNTVKFTPSNQDAAVRYLRMTINSFKGGYHQLAEFDAIGACETHTWVASADVDPTCTTEGEHTYACSVCGAVKSTGKIAALGHNYVEGICTRCGEPNESYMTAVDNFYLPTTVEQFTWLAAMIQANKTVNIKLTQDVDLTGFAGFGNGDNVVAFKGEFDGQGHWLKNLKIDAQKKNTGLFGMVEGANIHDLGLDNAYVKTSWGYANAGAIAGNAKNATINRVAVKGYVEGYDHVGSLVGNAEGSSVISNCYSDVNVKSAAYQAGGLVGTSNGLAMSNCLFIGTVANDWYTSSGLIALLEGTTSISNCVMAASKIEVGHGEGVYSLTNTNGRTETYSNNYVASSTQYKVENGEYETKTFDDKDGSTGLTTADKEMQCKSFYTETMGWDMTNDWKFVAAGQYPVLVWMDATAPTQEVTVSDAGYATIVAAGELNFDGSSVTAYAATLNGEYVHLEPVTAVPTGNAVVVKVAAGTYNIPYAVEYASDLTNELVAATTDVTATGTQYVLAQVGGKVGFHKVSTEEGKNVIAKGKGYLVIDGGSAKSFYPFEDDEVATTIENLTPALSQGEGVIYNVAGQRIAQPQKGINIINGKKYIVK